MALSPFDFDDKASGALLGGQAASSGMGTASPGLRVPGGMPSTAQVNADFSTAAHSLLKSVQAPAGPAAMPVVGFNPTTREVFAGGRTFHVDDVATTSAALTKGYFDQGVDAVPEGFGPMSLTDVRNYVAERANATPGTTFGDVGRDFKRGVLELPGAVTGIADAVTGVAGSGTPVGDAANAVGEFTGFQPGKWADQMQPQYSAGRQRQDMIVDEAWDRGVGEGMAETLANPGRLVGMAARSAPGMVAGGLGGRALAAGSKLISPVVGAAAGEGALMAGQSMDQLTKQGVDPQRAGAAALGIGAAGGAVSGVAGKLATKMGLPDLDVALAGGGRGTNLPLKTRVPLGAAQEGAEELSQSVMEQGGQNWAQEKPLTEGMARAGFEGALVGGMMGGAFQMAAKRGEALDLSKYADDRKRAEEQVRGQGSFGFDAPAAATLPEGPQGLQGDMFGQHAVIDRTPAADAPMQQQGDLFGQPSGQMAFDLKPPAPQQVETNPAFMSQQVAPGITQMPSTGVYTIEQPQAPQQGRATAPAPAEQGPMFQVGMGSPGFYTDLFGNLQQPAEAQAAAPEFQLEQQDGRQGELVLDGGQGTGQTQYVDAPQGGSARAKKQSTMQFHPDGVTGTKAQGLYDRAARVMSGDTLAQVVSQLQARQYRGAEKDIVAAEKARAQTPAPAQAPVVAEAPAAPVTKSDQLKKRAKEKKDARTDQKHANAGNAQAAPAENGQGNAAPDNGQQAAEGAGQEAQEAPQEVKAKPQPKAKRVQEAKAKAEAEAEAKKPPAAETPAPAPKRSAEVDDAVDEAADDNENNLTKKSIIEVEMVLDAMENDMSVPGDKTKLRDQLRYLLSLDGSVPKALREAAAKLIDRAPKDVVDSLRRQLGNADKNREVRDKQRTRDREAIPGIVQKLYLSKRGREVTALVKKWMESHNVEENFTTFIKDLMNDRWAGKPISMNLMPAVEYIEEKIQDARTPENATEGVDADWEKTQESLKGATTLGEALQRLTNLKSWQRVLVNLLAKSDGVQSAKLKLTGEWVDSKSVKDGIALGHYLDDKNEVHLHNGGGVASLLHEAVHAAVYNKMEADDAFRTKMTELYRRAEKVLGKRGDSAFYGMHNVQEFVAEAFTNPEFQRALDSVPSREQGARSGTMWDAFVDLVRTGLRLFGVQRTLLDDVIRLGSEKIDGDGPKGGQPKPASTTAENARKVQKSIDKAPPQLRTPLEKIYDSVSNLFNKGLYNFAFVHDLADIAGEALSSIKRYNELQGMKGALKNKLEVQVSAIGTEFLKLSKGAQTAVNQFVYDSTLRQQWGYKPSWDPEVEVSEDMAARWKELEQFPGAQDVVRRVFEYGHEIIVQKDKLINEEIHAEYEPLLAAAKTDEERAQLKKDKAAAIRERGRVLARMRGPYAPLRRSGKYVVVGKSAEYLKNAKNAAWMKENEFNSDHYQVKFFDSISAARQEEQAFQTMYPGGEVYAAEREFYAKEVNEAPFQSVQRLKQLVASELGEDSKYSAALNKALTDMYVATLSETHARHSEQKRRNIAGVESQDMMANFIKQGRADAHFVASLTHNQQINIALAAMRDQVKNSEGDRLKKSQIFNTVLRHHVANMQFDDSQWQNRVMSTTSVWMLLTNPAYYAQNMTQPWMMSLPMLNGRFGVGNSWKALVAGYKDVGQLLTKDVMKGLEALDPARLKNNVGKDHEMLVALRDSGVLDIGIESDFGKWEDTSGVGKVFSAVSKKLNMAARDVEIVNRVSTALAAYRLAYAAEVKTKSPEQAHADATDYAKRVLQQTHGDYSNFNAPLALKQGAWGSIPIKVLTQFRKFQIIQLSLMARVINQSLRGASKEERAVARAQLRWILGHAAVMTGVQGTLPAMVLYAIAAAVGGEDDPKEFELVAREAIGNEDLANLLLQGVPGWLGMDLTKKLGYTNMLSILPFTDVNLASREGVANTTMALMGPFIGGLLPRAADGVGMIRQGDYYKGLEQLMPSGVTNAMRAYRTSTEGMTARNGDVLMAPDEITFMQSMAQAMGLPTKKFTDIQKLRGFDVEFGKHFDEQTTRITRQYQKAAKEGDGEAMAEARNEWLELQAAKARYRELTNAPATEFKSQPLSTLLKSVQEQRKREMKSQQRLATGEL